MPFHPARRGLRSLSPPFSPDDTRLRQGLGSLPRPQTSEDDPEEERRQRRWDLLLEQIGELRDLPGSQKFNINEDRMENLLDTLHALVGGNTSISRNVSGRPTNYPSGRYRPSEEQAPAAFSQFRNPFGRFRTREGYPPHISLTAAGDYASRRAGEGFEMDPSGRPMTGEWSRPERFVAMHEAGHGVDASNIFPESLEKMQKESNAPMYPWQNLGEPSWPERAWMALERKMAGTYKSEKYATQFGKAVEILQDSLDPERRSEAVSRIDSPEMKKLVEGLLEHPVYENHPLRQRARGNGRAPLLKAR